MINDLIIGGVYDLNRTGQMVVATVLPVSKRKSSFGYLERVGNEVKCYEILEGYTGYSDLSLNVRTSRELTLDEKQRDIVNKILGRAGL